MCEGEGNEVKGRWKGNEEKCKEKRGEVKNYMKGRREGEGKR